MPIGTFVNEPEMIWGEEEIQKLQLELEYVQQQFNFKYPLYISHKKVMTEEKKSSINPSNHKEIVGHVSQASKTHIDDAIKAAEDVFQLWSTKTFQERAQYIETIGRLIREKKFELTAWLIYESGKNKNEAEGEINEAIDFIEMYAQGARKLDDGAPLIPMSGVKNEVVYLPLGVGVIIPPWNFPLAILVGLTVSAIVTGNTVLVKPSSSTPVVGAKFVEITREAGLPDGVINFVPGSSTKIGNYLVSHRDVNFISFTGSMEAALQIDELAHQRVPGQRFVKRMVAEMGGKGGIIVDETADLDQAADAIVNSAFGYQGQKCSAGARAIIHEDVYETLIDKIVKRTKLLSIGPSKEDTFIGPVIDENAYEKIMSYIEIGKKESSLIYGGKADKQSGYFIEPTIFKDSEPSSVLMQEEVFGPVLSICKVKDYKEGIDVYNNTRYGLTGAFFTEVDERKIHAHKAMVCGNLFINGKCTGAVVGVQPFGGYFMSGTGSKVGTHEFLRNFVQSKTISENL